MKLPKKLDLLMNTGVITIRESPAITMAIIQVINIEILTVGLYQPIDWAVTATELMVQEATFPKMLKRSMRKH